MLRLVYLLLACVLVATIGSVADASPEDPASQEASCPCGGEETGADLADDDLVFSTEHPIPFTPRPTAPVAVHEATVRSFDHDGRLFRPPDLR